jgi:hypothetical protein
MTTQPNNSRPRSHGVTSDRAVVSTEAGEVAVSLYTHRTGPDAGRPNLYVNNLDGSWTGIQLDISGKIVAVGHAATRDEAWHRIDPESNR